MTLAHAVESFDVSIPAAGAKGAAIALPGRLCLPAPPTGLVLFAHGSGSSRSSPRNAFVASVLHESWIGTLLFDLLTEQEATDRVNVFDVALLAERLLAAVRFVAGLEQTRHLPLGVFGASTGAAAGPTSPAASSVPCTCPRCSSWARPTRRCWPSTSGPTRCSTASGGWLWCRGRRTSSRSPARSRTRPDSLPNGSPSTSTSRPDHRICNRGDRR